MHFDCIAAVIASWRLLSRRFTDPAVGDSAAHVTIISSVVAPGDTSGAARRGVSTVGAPGGGLQR